MTHAHRRPWLARLLGPRTNSAGAADSGTKPAPVEIPTLVTRDRIAAYLHAREYNFSLDEDGDLTGTWDGNRFWFMLLGPDQDIVQVRGRWHRALAPVSRLTALQAINDWNRDRIWPKAYLRDEGEVLGVYTEFSVDLGPGVTKDQLDLIVAGGLGTSIQLFSTLSATLPPELPDGSEPDDS